MVSASEQRPFFEDQFGSTYRLIEPGSFTMGSASPFGRPNEMPAHHVSIREPFFIGERPVTQLHWASVMGTNPSKFQQGWSSGLRPVECVNLEDVTEFLRRLNLAEQDMTRMGLKGHWRLPSESEWEFVARANSSSRWWFGNQDAELDHHGWHAGNSGGHTREVGLKKSNPWGIYDMYGLVNEWCADHWVPDYQEARNQLPHHVESCSKHVVRGGTWFSESDSTRSGARGYAEMNKRSDGLGLRLVWAPFDVQSQ